MDPNELPKPFEVAENILYIEESAETQKEETVEEEPKMKHIIILLPLQGEIDGIRQKIDALPESSQQSRTMNVRRHNDQIYVVEYDDKANNVNIINHIKPSKNEDIMHFSEDIIVDRPQDIHLDNNIMQMASTSNIVSSNSQKYDDDASTTLNLPSAGSSSMISSQHALVKEEHIAHRSCLRRPSTYAVIVLYIFIIVIFTILFRTFIMYPRTSNDRQSALFY